MADSYKVLAQMVLTGGADTIYAPGVGKSAIISCIDIAAVVGDTVTFFVNGTASPGNVIIPTMTLATGDHGTDDAKRTLGATDSLRAIAGNANRIVVTVYGNEMS